MYYLAEMARREVKVVLDGSGGDELFGGYDRYYGNRFVDYYTRLPEAFRKQVMGRMLGKVPDGFWYKSLSHRLKWLNQMSFFEGGRRYTQSLSYFYFSDGFRRQVYGDKLLQGLNGFDPEEAIATYFEADNAAEPLDRMLYADSMIRLPDHPVMILDRTTLAHGLEARSPFLDHALTEFVARIPTGYKVRGGTRRYIQTRLAGRYLPPEILKRKKQGFSSGLPYLLADEFRRLFEVFLSDSQLVRDGYLRGEAIRTLLDEHLRRRVDQGNRLWLLCNAEVWYRMAIRGWTKDQVHAAIEAYAAEPL
jgi:asparagine synthase (glutamine-hydrolysing)